MKHMPEVEHLNGLTTAQVPRIVHSINAAQLKKILTKKSGKSSPGPSGVR
jgi:hypothetical protein